jgi:hypothetical protein
MDNTQSVPRITPFAVKQTDAPINRSRSGYGRRIPSSFMVKPTADSPWRRVYIVQYSNTGTPYIMLNGVFTVVDLLW